MAFQAREVMILTPRLGDDYPAACAALGLTARDDGWALLLAEDDDGKRVSLLTTDVAYAEMLQAAPAETLSGLTVPTEVFPLVRPGWPGEHDHE